MANRKLTITTTKLTINMSSRTPIFCYLLLLILMAFWLESSLSDTQQQAQPQQDNNPPSCSNNYQFDQFVFSIQWPLSFCYQKQECNLAAARTRKWFIHGLWPNRVQRQQPRPKMKRTDNQYDIAFCCGPTFNKSIITSMLQQKLLDKWPTLNQNAKHNGFWKHEWQKHGTCARGVSGLKNQNDYFETAISLYDRFDLNQLTTGSKKKFQSNQTYLVEEFHRELEPLINGKRVRIECSIANNKINGQQGSSSSNNNHNNNKISIFAEVHICLDKTLQPIDCGRNDDHQCKKRILFP